MHFELQIFNYKDTVTQTLFYLWGQTMPMHFNGNGTEIWECQQITLFPSKCIGKSDLIKSMLSCSLYIYLTVIYPLQWEKLVLAKVSSRSKHAVPNGWCGGKYLVRRQWLMVNRWISDITVAYLHYGIMCCANTVLKDFNESVSQTGVRLMICTFQQPWSYKNPRLSFTSW